MLWGDDESNCKHMIAASVGTELAGWRRGLDRLPALVPSLYITFPILLRKHVHPPQNGLNEIASCPFSVSKQHQPCCDRKKLCACLRIVSLTVFTSKHPFTKDTADKPLQGEKGSVQSTFSPAASSSYLCHIHRVTHTHVHISLSLFQCPSFCLINVCVLYPLLFAPRQLRHCSDGGGGRVYMCACV